MYDCIEEVMLFMCKETGGALYPIPAWMNKWKNQAVNFPTLP